MLSHRIGKTYSGLFKPNNTYIYNSNIRKKLNLNKWQNSEEVINWFEKIEEKHLYQFTVFDVEGFYPSIRKKLLEKAVTFARKMHSN